MRHLLILTALVAAMGAAAAAAVAATKPTGRDFDRVQLAKRAAFGKLGLVTQRGCDFDDLRCLRAATSSEASAFRRAATIARSVASSLRRGACRQVLAETAVAYTAHASDVTSAMDAWTARRYRDASKFYYRDWESPTLNGRIVTQCLSR